MGLTEVVGLVVVDPGLVVGEGELLTDLLSNSGVN